MRDRILIKNEFRLLQLGMHVRSSAQCSKNGQLQITVYAAYNCIHKFPFGFQAFTSWAQSLLIFEFIKAPANFELDMEF